ncbi:MAG: hypothetical protein PHN72_01010 [Bacilli bacterium]|nr:hypothetical protein [Bacilli bacterium]
MYEKTSRLNSFLPDLLVTVFQVKPSLAYNSQFIQELEDLTKDIHLDIEFPVVKGTNKKSNIKYAEGTSKVIINNEEASQVILDITELSVTITRYDTCKNKLMNRDSMVIRKNQIGLIGNEHLLLTGVHLIFQECDKKPLTRRIYVKKSICDKNRNFDISNNLKLEYPATDFNRSNYSYEDLLTIVNRYFLFMDKDLSEISDLSNLSPNALYEDIQRLSSEEIEKFLEEEYATEVSKLAKDDRPSTITKVKIK